MCTCIACSLCPVFNKLKEFEIDILSMLLLSDTFFTRTKNNDKDIDEENRTGGLESIRSILIFTLLAI